MPSTNIRSTVVAMSGCLLAFGAAMVLSGLGDQGLGPMALSVVLSLTLARHRRHTASVSGSVLVVAATGLAGGVGWLLAGPVPAVGDVAFVVVVAGAIALRRFGPSWTGVGVAATVPMIGLLVVPVVPQGPAGIPVLLAAAVTTLACLTAVRAVAERTGFLPVDGARPAPPDRSGPGLRPRVVSRKSLAGTGGSRRSLARRRSEPRTGLYSAGPATPPAGAWAAETGKGLSTRDTSDRMAVQMALGLGLAFVAGRLLFGSHWSWVVLTAYVVASGARGRGDVLHRGLLRMLGAGGGTVLASLVAALFAPGTPGPVVAIFVVLAVASWLRPRSYAWWAAGVTAVVALLSDFLGQDAAAVLPVRLMAIAVGGTIAVTVAWFVVPVRTSAVVRRRVADVLAALQEVLAAQPDHDAARARFTEALERLGEIAAPLRAHRRLVHRPLVALRRRESAHAADAVDALLACAAPVDALPAGGAVSGAARLVGELRRELRDPAGHLSPRFAELPSGLARAAV